MLVPDHFKTLLILEGRVLGEVWQPALKSDWGNPLAPKSLGVYCPTCGDVWFRIQVEGRPYVRMFEEDCRKHPRRRSAVPGVPPNHDPVAGSIFEALERLRHFAPVSFPLEAWLPTSLLLREIEIYSSFFDRIKQESNDAI